MRSAQTFPVWQVVCASSACVCAHLELGQLDDAALRLAPVRRRQRARAGARAGRRAVALGGALLLIVYFTSCLTYCTSKTYNKHGFTYANEQKI